MMTDKQKVFIIILISVSVLLFIASVAGYFRRIFKNKRTPEKCNKAGVSAVLAFSGGLILSIWILRFAIGYFSIVVSEPWCQPLSSGEEFVNSFFGALRTFSMDEDYAKYIRSIKAVIAGIIPSGNCFFSFCHFFMVIYASLLNIIAPIVGGTVILEILASVFPKIRLRFLYMDCRRKKYFFSELNAASLALAKSISAEKKSENPVLIFTDTYIDNENEKEYELLLEAEQYGAICVRDDLVHVAKTCLGKREYYLMDENEFGNLQTLMGLVDDYNVRFIKDSYIYLFVQSDAYVQIEKQVNLKLSSEQKKKLLKRGKKPVIVPVSGYRNLVHNLLTDIPLYEPLVNKADPAKLAVTILGNGIIGTEAFLSVFWFGQMLISQKINDVETMTDCDLTINVVSKDNEDAFWSKIDYINPEIQETVEVLNQPSHPSAGELLVYDSNGSKNKPYCKVRYIQQDVKIGGFWNGEIEEAQQLLNSDYFIVALGNDADNISVAEKLRRSIGKKHLEATSDNIVNNTVIAYSVFDSELAKMLNEHKHWQSREENKSDIYMHAFGSLEQVYSCENVYMSKSSVLAAETGKAYLKTQIAQSHIADNKERSQNGENGDYNYWANLARASHIKYKVFSLGWIEQSVFSYYADVIKCRVDESVQGIDRYEILPADFNEDCKIISSEDYHRELIEQICGKFKRIAISNNTNFADVNDQNLKTDLELKKHCLAWLEHRRWNAFTRTMGYQHTDVSNILEKKRSQKDMQLKLHSCLVEARQPSLEKRDVYIYAEFKADGKVDTESAFKLYSEKPLDRLDEVSYARRSRDPKKASDDFKMYDYYRYEFDNYLSIEEISELIYIDEEEIIRCCKKGLFKDAICFNEFSEWYIPFDSVKKEIENVYYRLDVEKPEEKDLIEKCKNGQCDKGFELFGTWFVTKEYATEELNDITTKDYI